MQRELTSAGSDLRIGLGAMSKIAFLIPVVHPERSNVSDYPTIERVLRETVRSCLAQKGIEVQVIIACHTRPDWPVDPRVTFIDVKGVDGLGPNVLSLAHDKGAKIVMAAQVALDGGATLVMPMDADDFVHHDLGVAAQSKIDPAKDGIQLHEGYHALINVGQSSISLSSVFKVRRFAQGCGSCRIIRADCLEDRLRAQYPQFSGEPFKKISQDVLQPGPALSTAICADITGQPLAKDHILKVLGRHGNQPPTFVFRRIPGFFAAKGCGHGNHAGPRHGDVHWHSIVGLAGRKAFLRAFHPDLRTGFPDVIAVLRGLFGLYVKR